MLAMYLLAAAVTIRGDTTLRAGCEADAEPVMALAAGQAVEVKFALAGGETECYKITAPANGRVVTGYVRGSDLEGLHQFDDERRAGAELATGSAIATTEKRLIQAIPASSALRRAAEAIENNEPGRAMEMLEPSAASSRDPNLLTLAGLAAWRNDDPRAALDYWKRALDLRSNPELERLYAKVDRESAADRSSGRIVGMRVLLRYEPQVVDAETARTMASVLDSEFSRIASQLGCSTRERVVAIVQSRDAYLRSSAAAEWSAGSYDGRIRVALADESRIGERTRRVFAHELVHACLANIGRFPPWLHEGLAQKLSGDQLSPAARRELAVRIEAHQFPKLEQLGQGLSGESADRARAIYSLALYATDSLIERRAELGLVNILRNPSLLSQVTSELDRELGL
jgi:hypothetical protein